MTRESILSILQREKPEMEKSYSINRIGLFGSYAAGTNKVGSDIDIVYEMKAGCYLGIDEKIKLEKHLQSLLKKKIDLVRLKYMNPAIRVKAEPQIVYV